MTPPAPYFDPPVNFFGGSGFQHLLFLCSKYVKRDTFVEFRGQNNIKWAFPFNSRSWGGDDILFFRPTHVTFS